MKAYYKELDTALKNHLENVPNSAPTIPSSHSQVPKSISASVPDTKSIIGDNDALNENQEVKLLAPRVGGETIATSATRLKPILVPAPSFAVAPLELSESVNLSHADILPQSWLNALKAFIRKCASNRLVAVFGLLCVGVWMFVGMWTCLVWVLGGGNRPNYQPQDGMVVIHRDELEKLVKGIVDEYLRNGSVRGVTLAPSDDDAHDAVEL
jgi:hypothetical protein